MFSLLAVAITTPLSGRSAHTFASDLRGSVPADPGLGSGDLEQGELPLVHFRRGTLELLLWHRRPQFTQDTFHEVCEA